MIGINATRPKLGLALQNVMNAPRNMGVPDPSIYGVPSFNSPSANTDQPSTISPPMVPSEKQLAKQAMPAGDGRPDYAAMLTAALGPEPHQSTLQKIASIAGPVLMAISGNGEMAERYLADAQRRRDALDDRRRDAALTAVKWRREDDLDAAKRNEPRYFGGNTDQVRYDPSTGQSTRIYDAPRDFEEYAALAGEPGTPAYANAAEDYVLRSHGPTAFEYYRGLEAIRQAGRTSLEAQRQKNRLSLRGTPTYRDTHPQPHAGRSGPARPTATGPNGEKMEYDGHAWVPVK